MKMFLVMLLSAISVLAVAVEDVANLHPVQPVIVMKIQPDVSEEDAVDAMVVKAGELNLAVVAVHRSEYVTSVELCAPSIAVKILQHSPELAVYVPCRISVIDGKVMTLDFSGVLQTLPSDLQQLAETVIDRVGLIMVAGIKGEF